MVSFSAVKINPNRAVSLYHGIIFQEKSQYLFIIIDGVSIHEIETQNYESASNSLIQASSQDWILICRHQLSNYGKK